MPAPRDEPDVAEILAATRDPLEPVGSGSRRAVGRPVNAAPLDLSALAGILDYEPRELTLTARAATPLQEIEQALGAHAQRLAFEPPDWSRLLGCPGGTSTIGGVLCSNLSGSRRLSAGAARDHFLGFRAVSGRGEVFKAGGRVVKNVTGYDLPKLLAGSWGTLAVLTEVTVRVHPAPELERTLLLPLEAPAAAIRAMTAALASHCDVSAAAFAPTRGVALRLEGFAPSVEARARALVSSLEAADGAWLQPADSRRFWQALGAVEPLASCPVVWRLSVPPSEAAAILERLA
ncbi:MAG: FAD-binding protein, partial [Steroidobacteraceae bacterium]